MGSSLLPFGDHFSISGEPWGTILAPQDNPWRPWEQQDGLEVVDNRILVDFGMILGRVYIGFLEFKMLEDSFCFGLVSRPFV